MWDCQFRFIDDAIGIEDDIDVQRPWSVGLISDASVLALEILEQIGSDNRKNEFYLTDAVAIARRMGRKTVALEVAQARDFVEQLGGLDAPIAQGGTNVSGGQRQRLAIARVLVHKPQIYLFDDSFSALDYATDAALRAALPRATADATVVIVAQRVNTIRHADQIVVLDEGRVVGAGVHGELMRDNPTYREIVLSQVSEEEAA